MRHLFGCGNWLPPMIELPRVCLVRGENLELEPQGKFAIDERIFKANGSKTSYVGILKYLYTYLRTHNEHEPGVKTP